MSDNCNSTGSSASSTNSWTLLSPEEAAGDSIESVESAGPVDDGTESLGDVPSLSEEVAGAAADDKPIDIAIETILSEEGHQVCQETSPDDPSEGPVPSSPTRESPLPPSPLDAADLDLESQPPVIHEIDASSPSDSDNLGAAPLVTNIDLGAPLDIPDAEFPPADFQMPCFAAAKVPLFATVIPDATEDIGQIPEVPAEKSPAEESRAEERPTEENPAEESSAEEIRAEETRAGESPAEETRAEESPAEETRAEESPAEDSPAEECPALIIEEEIDVHTETIAATEAPAHVDVDVSVAPEKIELSSPVPASLVPGEEEGIEEEVIEETPAPEIIGSVEKEEEQAMAVEKEATDTWETGIQEERHEEDEQPISSVAGDVSGFDDGPRRRNVADLDARRPRTSDEEDEEEEVEFRLAQKKEEKPWFSVNKCIVGAAILLFLGSLFLSGDFDTSDVADGEQSQDWPSADPQEMKELLDKLTQENQHIAQLEAQLKSQKEELSAALGAVAESDESKKADLEKENAKLKEELSSLPGLRTELEALRARVTELTELTAIPMVPQPTPQPHENEAETNQKPAGPEKSQETHGGVRLTEELHRQKVLLEESRKRLEGMKKDHGGRKDVRNSLEQIQQKLSEKVERWEKSKPQEHKWKGDKRGKKDERDHWKKEDKKEWKGDKEWKHGKDGGRKEERKEKDWKPQKQNSHKEAWRKHQDEWERKKGERRTDREERRKEKPWHKSSHQHHGHEHHQQPPPRRTPQHHHNDFWRDQEAKLRRNFRPQLGCSSIDACAAREGLFAVELPEFEELLEGYLSKLEGSPAESKDKVRKLAAEFFEGGVFVHDRVLFGDFAEDVADILEDMVDIVEDNDSLEEEMEEFEREALWKFAATA